MEVKEKKMESFKLKDFIELPDFNKLYGRGGSFLVTPLDSYKVFSREQFSEEQKMFAKTAYDFAVNRIRKVKDEFKSFLLIPP